MYSVSPEAAGLWRRLLAAVIEHAGLDIELLLNTPRPRPSMSCGNAPTRRPCSCAACRSPVPILAPSSSPRRSPRRPIFAACSAALGEMVVRKDSRYQTIEDTFGGRIALTVPDSQSGCLAALHYLMAVADRFPLYGEVTAPKVTPLGAMSAVIDGAADVAPIDSYAFCLLRIGYQEGLDVPAAHHRTNRAHSRPASGGVQARI